jgi:ABC-2 type transport system permease protein
MLIALGVLASSLTRNQVISGLCTFVVLLALFSIGLLSMFVRDPESAEVIRYLSLPEHINDFSKGLLDTRPLVLYACVSAIALLLTGRVIANPRWRS